VLDGVVAPTDTFRSLHFAEVAEHFITMHIPRGAYPARAMATKRWDTLSTEHQQVLNEGIAVWEKALEQENDKALGAGLTLAQQEGVNFTTLPADEQQRFNALYLTQAERNAQELARYGIDGTEVFALSRQSIGADGNVTCPGVTR
jgi:TRAP-type C4-dicarboxylate transport system substrate-binding protein